MISPSRLLRLMDLDYAINWKTPGEGDLFERGSDPNILLPTDEYRALGREFNVMLKERWAKRVILQSIRLRIFIRKVKGALR